MRRVDPVCGGHSRREQYTQRLRALRRRAPRPPTIRVGPPARNCRGLAAIGPTHVHSCSMWTLIGMKCHFTRSIEGAIELDPTAVAVIPTHVESSFGVLLHACAEAT